MENFVFAVASDWNIYILVNTINYLLLQLICCESKNISILYNNNNNMDFCPKQVQVG
jgi:hypothetical protein